MVVERKVRPPQTIRPGCGLAPQPSAAQVLRPLPRLLHSAPASLKGTTGIYSSRTRIGPVQPHRGVETGVFLQPSPRNWSIPMTEQRPAARFMPAAWATPLRGPLRSRHHGVTVRRPSKGPTRQRFRKPGSAGKQPGARKGPSSVGSTGHSPVRSHCLPDDLFRGAVCGLQATVCFLRSVREKDAVFCGGARVSGSEDQQVL